MKLYDVTGCRAEIIRPDTNLSIWGQVNKPFAVCNASLYDGVSTMHRPSGPPIGTIIENGKFAHNDGNGFGCGILWSDSTLQFGQPWEKSWKEYLTGYNSPVQNGAFVPPSWEDSYVFGYRLARIGIGKAGEKTFIVTGDGMTLKQFAERAIASGLDTLVNLDGGRSRHLYYDGKTIYSSPRIPYNAIAFYQKDSSTVPQDGSAQNDTEKCPYPEPARNLFLGCRGEDVKWLQWKLKKRGYDCNIDGVFGWQTWWAVWYFQKTWSKAPDGICGPNTRGELNKNDL